MAAFARAGVATLPKIMYRPIRNCQNHARKTAGPQAPLTSRQQQTVAQLAAAAR